MKLSPENMAAFASVESRYREYETVGFVDIDVGRMIELSVDNIPLNRVAKAAAHLASIAVDTGSYLTMFLFDGAACFRVHRTFRWQVTEEQEAAT